MSRPILVLLLATAVLGMLAGYNRFLATLPAHAEQRQQTAIAEGHFRIAVQLSFDAESDAFALPGDPTLQLRLGGHELLHQTGIVHGSAPLMIEQPTGIVAGKNALFLRAVPGAAWIRRPCAVQVRILRDDKLLAEHTLWSTPGDVVAGEMRFDLTPPQDAVAEPTSAPSSSTGAAQ